MANFANSSLSVWLNWGGVLPPVIRPGQSVQYNQNYPYSYPTSLENVSCAQVCNNTVTLFDSNTNNLETCGLWLSSLVTPDSPGSPGFEDILPRFSTVGLGTSTYQYNITYADTISACLVEYSVKLKLGTYSARNSILGLHVCSSIFFCNDGIVESLWEGELQRLDGFFGFESLSG